MSGLALEIVLGLQEETMPADPASTAGSKGRGAHCSSPASHSWGEVVEIYGLEAKR